MRRTSVSFAAALATLAAVAGVAAAPNGLTGDAARASRARDAITELDVTAGRRILEGASSTDGLLSIEQGRLALYAGDYDGAARILGRADLAATAEGAELGDVARGAARSMSAALVLDDAASGVTIRLQDDADRALAPLLALTASRVREQLVKDLGVELPRPLHVDVVRDQFSLAAMTGLPEQAAQTTGTVAIAKWGRVTMVSPRATYRGYPWLDTLAHEMTHLALSRGTRDKAPLWLQEGVAKREETRWRDVEPLDDVPAVDAIAAAGIEKGLGRSLDKLGPSIAMLPTAEQAQVAFAEVQSFVRYYIKEQGDDALVKLVAAIKANDGPNGLEESIKALSGLDFVGWDKKWRAHITGAGRDLPPDLAPGADVPHAREVARRVRLGELLHGRGHDVGAAIEFEKAHATVAFDASIRAYLGEALLANDERDKAAALFATPEELHGKQGRWWSLRAMLAAEGDEAERAIRMAVELDPLDPHVACEERDPPKVPLDSIRAAICEAARVAPPFD
ncbi:MAG TPA: hypothetical protein VGM56_24105 [Byssovorax sp.]